jgi:hypothetical protein
VAPHTARMKGKLITDSGNIEDSQMDTAGRLAR